MKKTIIQIGRGVKCINPPKEIQRKIEGDLCFQNPLYQAALRQGRSTGNLNPYVVLYDKDDNTYWLPRGYVYYLMKFIKNGGFPYILEDETLSLDPLNLKFKGKLRDYQEEAKGAILQYPVGILEALTGCLTGDTIVRLNRAGKGFSCTLKKLYEGFNKHWDISIPTKIRSFNHDANQILLNKVEAVLYSGIKPIYQFNLEDGKFVKGTLDHKILTSKGWKALKDIEKYDEVMVDKIKEDNKGQLLPAFVKVKDKKYLGEMPTYDICCQDPYNNFTANDIVVHNSGKTTIALSVIAHRKQPTLILVHTTELLLQWRDRIKTFLGEDCGLIGNGKFQVKPITVGTIQTVHKRFPEITDSFGHLVIDECFVEGTLVDGKPIETIKVGDYVNSFNHETNQIEKKKVLHVFKTKLKGNLCQINLKNKKGPISTTNHPFYCVNERKYLTALQFNDTHSVYNIERETLLISQKEKKNERKKKDTQHLSYLRKTHNSSKQRTCSIKNETCKNRKWKMFRRMLPKSQRNRKNKIGKVVSQLQQFVCWCQNEEKKSFIQSRNYRKSKNYQKTKRDITYLERKEGRKRTINNPTRKISLGFRMENRSCYPYSGSFTNRATKRMEYKEKSAYLLQGGHRQSLIKNSHRSRCEKSQNQTSKKFRQEERISVKMERVESVEIYKRGDRHQLSKVCRDGFVYNIEVEDNNNYFAEGILVHNCHRYGSHTTAYTIQEFPAKYFLGLTATPFRSDGLTKIIFAGIGPKIHKIDRQGLFETGAVLKPDIRRVPTNFRYVFANDYAAMISSLVQNDERNLLICAEIALYLQHVNESILIVTDRKNHAEIIRETLLNKYKINSSMLLGTTKKKDRVQTTEDIRSGKSKVLIATSQLISEGYDMANLSALFLTTPIKFSGKLIQACGRILRPKEGKNPLIVDFRDDYVQVLKYSGYARDKTFNNEWR